MDVYNYKLVNIARLWLSF